MPWRSIARPFWLQRVTSSIQWSFWKNSPFCGRVNDSWLTVYIRPPSEDFDPPIPFDQLSILDQRIRRLPPIRRHNSAA